MTQKSMTFEPLAMFGSHRRIEHSIFFYLTRLPGSDPQNAERRWFPRCFLFFSLGHGRTRDKQARVLNRCLKEVYSNRLSDKRALAAFGEA